MQPTTEKAPPLALRLPFRLADPRCGWRWRAVVRAALGPELAARETWAYLLSGPERRFALTLLAGRRHQWLYRTHQGASCGDFVVVDMSMPDPLRRRSWAIELKSSGPLREGVRGMQLRRCEAALAEIAAREGVVAGTPAPRVLLGTPQAVLAQL